MSTEIPVSGPRSPRRLRRFLKWTGLGFAIFIGIVVAAYVLFTGPRNLDAYPDATTSPYKLPWPAGVTYLCCQSNRGIVSHRGWEEFAYDFSMPVGSDVCAARAGMVTLIEVSHDGHGNSAPNNFIAIDHGDLTAAWYLHLKKDGSYVQVGQHVAQGERIAASGHVGISLIPHLHFHVVNVKNEVERITFSDVTTDRGIPRMFKSYKSGNAMQVD